MSERKPDGIFISPELFEDIMSCLETDHAWSTDLPTLTHGALVEALLNGKEEPASVFDDPGFATWAHARYEDQDWIDRNKPPAGWMIHTLVRSSEYEYDSVAAVAAAYVADRDATKDES